MSIYSGFATRAQEECYDQCIESLLFVLQRRIIKFYRDEPADEEKFVGIVLRIHQQLRNMENHKYLEPKTSHTLTELVQIMEAHARNSLSDRKLPDTPLQLPATHGPLPQVEHRQGGDSVPRKKESLWVEKKVPKQDLMVDQQIQTMGTIYQKRESPKQSSASRVTQPRHTISGLKTKAGYAGDKPREALPATGPRLKARSNSHALAPKQTFYYDQEVRNHLKEMETSNRKRRRDKVSRRLGLPTEERSDYEVSDIIRDYVVRQRRKFQPSFPNKSPDF